MVHVQWPAAVKWWLIFSFHSDGNVEKAELPSDSEKLFCIAELSVPPLFI